MIDFQSDAAAPSRHHGLNGSRIASQRRKDQQAKHHVATSEREYSGEEMEFLGAIEKYKNKTGQKFPTWTEVLSVVHSLGYVKPL